MRPRNLFDREGEWSDLERFLADDQSRLGIVWGPRRVGKSFLTYAFSHAVGGLYVQGTRDDPALFLEDLGQALGARTGAPAPLALPRWRDAVDALLTLPDTPLVVLDEFPYLVESSPSLPTVMQAALDAGLENAPRNRLLLCGSAVSQMTRLLARDGPLHRRAQLTANMTPFDLRTAAHYWGLDDRPIDAVSVHAIVGGAPGYRDILGTVDHIDDWVVDRVLNPGSSLFYEDDLVFATDPDLPDSNVYRSIITAVARGERTVTGVASRTGRQATSLAKPLQRLIDAGVLMRVPDPLRARGGRIDLVDPFLTFHQVVIQPNRAALARRRAREVWRRRGSSTFRSQLLGPRFEHICRQALLDYDFDLPVEVADVGATKLLDPQSKRHLDVDVAATDADDRIVLLAEVKASAGLRTSADLRRLDFLRTLLPADRRAPEVHLVLFSLHGVSPDLAAEANDRDDVTVIDAATLCA
jgi:uncharacterized protein